MKRIVRGGNNPTSQGWSISSRPHNRFTGGSTIRVDHIDNLTHQATLLQCFANPVERGRQVSSWHGQSQVHVNNGLKRAAAHGGQTNLQRRFQQCCQRRGWEAEVRLQGLLNRLIGEETPQKLIGCWTFKPQQQRIVCNRRHGQPFLPTELRRNQPHPSRCLFKRQRGHHSAEPNLSRGAGEAEASV